ncbi:MAG: ASKHA domain-containing protein [Planctomycetota bacterium]|jgi:uncharacterized 2Fe-2S/4Fe-4S cluster protein (DUF4445 family)|nr:ASKHA domain-containing protein [Planctomycetota bacterium]
MPTISIFPSGQKIAVSPGSNLLSTLQAAGLAIPSSCGGRGICGKCRVKILTGLVPTHPREASILPTHLQEEGWRVACLLTVDNDLTLVLPDNAPLRAMADFISREPMDSPQLWLLELDIPPPTPEDKRDDKLRFLSELSRRRGQNFPRIPLDGLSRLPGILREHRYRCQVIGFDNTLIRLSRPGRPDDRHLGVALDLGTTTLAVALIDMQSGQVLATASGANPQAVHGDDVVSRIEYASRGETELHELHQLVLQGVAELVEKAKETAKTSDPVLLLTLAANPAMNHIFLGVDPQGLATSPFLPAFRDSLVLRGEDIGWHAPLPSPPALVITLPNIAAYVGGDIVAGLATHRLGEDGENTLYFDIGTNGEIVLATGGKLFAAATAAGPAFEGARIGQGMRAAPGAVTVVDFSAGRVSTQVMDNVPARGICGTGLLDTVAILVQHGLVTAGGHLLTAEEAAARPDIPTDLKKRLVPARDGSGVSFQVVWPEGEGEGVAVSQKDIREFQLAKGALAAGAAILLKTANIPPEAVSTLILAGGFGSYLNPESALAVGLLPPGTKPVTLRGVGNASLAGARLSLLSRRETELATQLAEATFYIELSGLADFEVAFAENMLFPSPNADI